MAAFAPIHLNMYTWSKIVVILRLFSSVKYFFNKPFVCSMMTLVPVQLIYIFLNRRPQPSHKITLLALVLIVLQISERISGFFPLALELRH